MLEAHIDPRTSSVLLLNDLPYLYTFLFFLSSFLIHTILPICQRKKFGHGEAFYLPSSIQVLPLDVITPRDSYAWNYRELGTLLTLSESLAEVGFEPLTIG